MLDFLNMDPEQKRVSDESKSVDELSKSGEKKSRSKRSFFSKGPSGSIKSPTPAPANKAGAAAVPLERSKSTDGGKKSVFKRGAKAE